MTTNTHKATLGGETILFHDATWTQAVEALMAKFPGQGVPKIERLGGAPESGPRPAAPRPSLTDAESVAERAAGIMNGRDWQGDRAVRDGAALVIGKVRFPVAMGETAEQCADRAVAFVKIQEPSMVYSDFGAGRQVVDPAAERRIEGLHAKLRAAGVAVDAGSQLYATGTRMAKIGYESQAGRRAEHESKQLLSEAAGALRAAVASEGREDAVVCARDVADAIAVNGKVSAFGLALSEQAIRGLLGRLESPGLTYVLGLRDRIADRQGIAADRQGIAADRAKIAEILRHECMRTPEVELKLRMRASRGDVFAVVSPAYAPADAPAVLDEILGGMQADARGSWAYDPSTTSWELRASVWTPTPVAEQCVGEPFEGYVSFQARDNGTGRLRGGGGVVLLACLNAGTYVADGADVSRVHRGKIMVDVADMLKGSLAAIDALCDAWGRARRAVVEGEELVGLPISKAIPGLYAGELLDRRSELYAVLPGRSAEHVKGLTAAYMSERRDPERVVRADLAQGWTRYIQAQPTPVRREAEAAIASWLVAPPRLRFDGRGLRDEMPTSA